VEGYQKEYSGRQSWSPEYIHIIFVNINNRQRTDIQDITLNRTGKKTKNGVWNTSTKQLDYNFTKSLYNTQNIRNDIKIEL